MPFDTSAATKYKQKYGALDAQYTNWETLYKDISDYVLPTHGAYLDRGDPTQVINIDRFNNILNDTASRANQILGAGMQGGLASPSRRWFRLAMTDKDLGDFTPVKEWLHTCQQIIYAIYASSNFYIESHNVFESQGGFGTAVLLQEEDPESVVNFRCFEVGEYRIAAGKNGVVDTCYRMMWLTAKQLGEMFPKKYLSAKVKTALEPGKNPYEYFEVLHVIEPRTGRDTTKIDNTNMAYSSVWLENNGESGVLLRNSGYIEKPIVVPRWSKIGQIPYGFGPGVSVRGNAKMMQEMEKASIMTVHQQIKPALSVPAKYKGVVSLLPGATNYVDGNEKIEPILNVNLSLQDLEFKLSEIEQRISQGFYNDLFMMIINADRAGRDMTATEILARKEEKMLLLGPTIERQIKEFLDPTIERTFNICLRNGLFPPPPPEIEGQEWEAEYISVLAQAQKLADAQSMNAYLGEIERVAQLNPHMVHKTDWEEYVEQYADIVGVPPKVIHTKDEYAEKMQAVQQAEQQQAQMEQMGEMSGAIRNLGSAKSEGTALETIGEAIGGQA